MASRHSVYRFDWTRNDRVHWLVRADEFRRPLKIQKLDPGTDLLTVFLEEALAVHREGWTIAELTMTRAWFLAHNSIRQLLRVDITEIDPGVKHW